MFRIFSAVLYLSSHNTLTFPRSRKHIQFNSSINRCGYLYQSPSIEGLCVYACTAIIRGPRVLCPVNGNFAPPRDTKQWVSYLKRFYICVSQPRLYQGPLFACESDVGTHESCAKKLALAAEVAHMIFQCPHSVSDFCAEEHSIIGLFVFAGKLYPHIFMLPFCVWLFFS